ncbi:glycogen synthase GlgA [Bacillus massiliigorillae]|uniref:glycogen synthase GlgA n=1 Tax=Bacillus massiliigorillae TaxID=1243664 RepID=UPI0003A3581A|nr:glycogen synthase GlgA [Bacillus massiliigorillae]
MASKSLRKRKNIKEKQVIDKREKVVSKVESEIISSINEVAAAVDTPIIEKVSKGNKQSEKIKVLIAASEGLPFVATGGLGEVVGSLPKAIMKENNEKFDIRVILPLYESITNEDRQQMEFLGHFNVSLSWRQQYCGVFRIVKNDVTYYFIDNEYYFKRFNPYGYYDDGERYAFFSKAVLDSIALLNFDPDIIHCHDWQTALIPVYLHYNYHHIQVQTIFTIHNIEYQGKMDLSIIGDLFGLSPEAGASIEYDGCANLMKAAIECSNQVNTVSPTYARELINDYFAKGLAAIIQKNEFKMRGILNGIDVESYNPETDSSLFLNYGIDSIENKKVNKAELQKLANLPVDENVPVIAIVSRLVSHKGLDLITAIMEQVVNENVQVVVLGIGERKYEDYFKWLQSQYPGKVAAMLCFNQDLARKVYAGADIFLMPSKSEPCGLAQMIASRYGTVPIVQAVGGLRDTIQDCSVGEGNGFVFDQYNSHALLDAIHRALHVYHNKESWNNLVKWVMSIDFSWEKSAREYEKLYLELGSRQVQHV